MKEPTKNWTDSATTMWQSHRGSWPPSKATSGFPVSAYAEGACCVTKGQKVAVGQQKASHSKDDTFRYSVFLIPHK